MAGVNTHLSILTLNVMDKDPKNSTQKLLDTINSFSNAAEYKINL
jgi:hypothetical protein